MYKTVIFSFLRRNMSRHLGFDLRIIIQDIKNISKKDIHQIALQIHVALQYNSSKHNINHQKFLNRLLKILHCSHHYRKIKRFFDLNT